MKNKRNLFLIAGLFVLFFLIYLCIMYLGGMTDLPLHAQHAVDRLENGELLSGHFLFFLCVNIFSAFSRNIDCVKIVMCILLSMATVWRYYIVKKDIFSNDKYSNLLSLSLIFVFIIPILVILHRDSPTWLWENNWYLGGYCVPNVWHNSTTIFLFPFALLLLLLAIKQIEKYAKKRNLWIILLVVLNVWIKPSYFMVFVCVYPCFLLWRYGWRSKYFYYSLIPIIVGASVMLWEYISIYFEPSEVYTSNESSIILSVDQIKNISWWRIYFKYIIASLMFPIIYIITHWRNAIRDNVFWFVLIQIIVAIGISLLVQETGPRASHGNFYWQIVICVWFAYCYALKKTCLSIKTSEGKLRICDISILVFYACHVLIGLAYLLRIIITQNYY